MAWATGLLLPYQPEKVADAWCMLETAAFIYMDYIVLYTSVFDGSRWFVCDHVHDCTCT